MSLLALMIESQKLARASLSELNTDIERVNFLTRYSTHDKAFFSGPVECYTKFGITPSEVEYSAVEHKFRVVCLKEELKEFKEAREANNVEEQIDAIVDLLFFAIGTAYRANILPSVILKYPSKNTSNSQIIIDSVCPEINTTVDDCVVYYIEQEIKCLEHSGVIDQESIIEIVSLCILYLHYKWDKKMITEYYGRVTAANLSKELGSLSKRGDFALDLIKPEGWKAPNFDGLKIK